MLRQKNPPPGKRPPHRRIKANPEKAESQDSSFDDVFASNKESDRFRAGAKRSKTGAKGQVMLASVREIQP
jgi:hypothetical protein